MKKADAAPPKPVYLTVQMFIQLLTPSYLDEFKKYLQESNSVRSLRLVEYIEQHPEASPELLCRKIYGDYSVESRHTFNQLCSYTFKLSFALARNYPAYLHPNTEKLHQLVNEGRVAEANHLGHILLEIAEKICDYHTQVFCLKFFTQQAYITKDYKTGLRLHERLVKVIGYEATYQMLHRHYRSKLNSLMIDVENEKEIREALGFLKSYFDHESLAIQLYARHAYVCGLYYLRPAEFETKAIYEEILPRLLSDLNNHGYVIFHFFSDLRTYLMFFKINSPFTNLDKKKDKEEFERWTAHFRSVKFWEYYLNEPEILAVGVKSNYYIVRFFHYAHKKKKVSFLTEAQKRDLDRQIKSCEALFEDVKMKPRFEKHFINVYPIYASLLTIHPDRSTEEAIRMLEILLTSHQQTSIGLILDNIFSWLIIGYFCTGKYDECSDTFMRYQKAIRGKVFYEHSDIIIHFYYYLCKWILTGRKQFLQKLKATCARIPDHEAFQPMRDSFISIAKDFKVPLWSKKELPE